MKKMRARMIMMSMMRVIRSLAMEVETEEMQWKLYEMMNILLHGARTGY